MIDTSSPPLTGSVFGVPVRLHVDAAARDSLATDLPGWVPGAVGADAVEFAVPGGATYGEALSSVENHVAQHAPGLVFVHAGAVAVDGRAIVLPGHTRAGKSTLVTALVAAGATYYSDEFAIFDSGGNLLPYARPVQLRSAPDRPSDRSIDPATLGAVGTEPVPVAVVAHLTYADAWQVDALTPARTALALLANAIAGRTRTAEVLERLARVAEPARGLTGTRGDAADAARRLIEIVGR